MPCQSRSPPPKPSSCSSRPCCRAARRSPSACCCTSFRRALGLAVRRDWDQWDGRGRGGSFHGIWSPIFPRVLRGSGAAEFLRQGEDSFSHADSLLRAPSGDWSIALTGRSTVSTASTCPRACSPSIRICRCTPAAPRPDAGASRWRWKQRVGARRLSGLRLTEDMFVAPGCGPVDGAEIPDGSWCVFRAGVTGLAPGAQGAGGAFRPERAGRRALHGEAVS